MLMSFVKNKIEKIAELLCVAAFVAFIVLLTKGTSVSEKTAPQMFEAVKQVMQLEQYADVKKQSGQKFKKQFGFSESDFDSAVYYASDNVMQVREILILKLKDGSSPEPVQEKLSARVDEKAALFKGYAPEQGALLDRHVLLKKGGFILFAVCDKPDELVSLFKKSL